MEDSNESKKTSKEMENLSLLPNRFSRDLLQRFMGTEFEMGKEDSEEIELNLGLSLGGKFGVDKSKLIRSSSIAGSIPIIRDDDAVAPSRPVPYPSLVRTSSLPAQTEEEWRKRKELQTLRRMAAKRRRSEKQRNLKGDKDGGTGGGGEGGMGFEDENKEIEKSLRGKVDREQLLAMKRFGSSLVVPPVGFPSRAAAGGAKQGASGGSTGKLSSQGSMESQGGSSSSFSQLRTKAFLGSSNCKEVSNAVIHSLCEWNMQEGVGSSGAKMQENLTTTSGSEMENPSKGTEIAGKKGKEGETNSMEDMPCVFTKVDGPNGRRIDGILYRYGKGEEVRIMCVCHGSFLSPAEFVKHAGGTDITNPLKHIVVNPNSSFFC